MDLLKYAEGLQREIQALIDKESEAVAGGAATDFADYKRRTGVISGLKRALLEVSERRRNSIEDDDDDV